MGYCKWTKGCTSPGPWLAWIDGNFYECTEPEKASRLHDEYAQLIGKVCELAEEARTGNIDAKALLPSALHALCFEKPRPIYCVKHAREFQRLNICNTITDDGESVRNPKASPLLLFCRRHIDTAIDDAKETDPATGEPTDEAMLQRLWIEYRPDQRDPEDFYGSFEWCCHWLSIDVEVERKDAIEEIENSLARRLLAVKRAQWDQRSKEVLYLALASEEQAAVRAAQLAAARRSQLVMEFGT